MARDRITKRSVDALTCPQGRDRTFIWDSTLSGFGVAAHRSGRKTYAVQYRRNGVSRRVTIGEHGRLTPDQARSEAKKLLGAIESGSDPIAERAAARAVRTLCEIAEEFLTLHAAAKRKPSTLSEYRRLLRLRILPVLGGKRIIDIRRVDVARLHGSLAGTPYEANRCVALMSAVWNWAGRRDEVGEAANPCKGVERYPEKGRERFLTIDELGRLGDALTAFEANGSCPYAVGAIRLLALTGARLREVLDAKWSGVDLGRGILFLEDSKALVPERRRTSRAGRLATPRAQPTHHSWCAPRQTQIQPRWAMDDCSKGRGARRRSTSRLETYRSLRWRWQWHVSTPNRKIAGAQPGSHDSQVRSPRCIADGQGSAHDRIEHRFGDAAARMRGGFD
jgi:integrase